MARVRVLIYRDESDEVLEDFICENPCEGPWQTAAEVKASIPDALYIGDTEVNP